MDDFYSPPSVFLCEVLNDNIPLDGSSFASDNLRRLLSLTKDENVENRDWATFLVANLDFDTPEIKQALWAAAHDVDCDVRAEAIEGLAKRDPKLTLPLVQRDLAKDPCGYGVVVAAELLAHPSLLETLRNWEGRSVPSPFKRQLIDAIKACERAANSSLHNPV